MPDYQSPYAPRILQLSTALQSSQDAPLEPMFTPEEIRARKAKQLREEQLAVLAKLSGNKELETVGATLLPDALKMAAPRYTEHGEFDPLSGQHTVFPEYTRRVKEQRLEQQLQTTMLKDQSAQQHQQLLNQQQEYMRPYRDATLELQQQRLELARQRLLDAQNKAAQGKPLTGQVYKDVKKLGDDVQNLDQIKEGFDKNFSAATSQGVSSLGGLQDTLAAAVPGLAPDQWVKNRSAWADLQRLKEMKQRYDLFGATLTGNEKTSWQSVTPPRGATQEQLGDWMREQDFLLRKAIGRHAEAAAAGGWNKKQIEEYTNGVWRAPVAPAGDLSPQEQQELDALRARFPNGRP